MSTQPTHRRTISRDVHARDQGFTLIELLVVVVILGILIAIAIPVYLNYRRGANDKAAQSDLRGTVSTLELCYSDSAVYPLRSTFTSGASAGSNGIVCANRTGAVSANTTVTYYASADQSAYIISATAGSSGGAKTYCYNSLAGGGISSKATASFTALTAYRDAC